MSLTTSVVFVNCLDPDLQIKSDNFGHDLNYFFPFLSGDFFSKSNVFKKVYDTNDSDTDQDQHSVNPHLSPNCLQRLSEDNMSPLARKELKQRFFV